MAYRTPEQMFRNQWIIGSYSQLAASGTAFEDYYGLGPGGPAERTPVDYFSADIFNNTRLLSDFRNPKAGPATVGRKPSGQFTGHVHRIHEKMPILDNDIGQYRPIGGRVGVLDAAGQRYVANQTRFQLQKMRNLREYTLASTLKGGYGLKSQGEGYTIVAKGAGDFDVDSKIPSTNLTTVEGIFAADSWDTSSTDIVAQFLALNAHAERVSGTIPAVAWINTAAYTRMINNSTLRSQSGTAYRIFDLQTRRQINTIPDGSRSSGWMVKFDMLPQITFIVYDAVLNVDKTEDSTADADSTKFIPDGKMIVTPAPSADWIGQVVGGEWVRENKADNNPVFRYGFYNWVEPTTQPAGREIIFLDKWLHYLKMPNAVYYINIYTP